MNANHLMIKLRSKKFESIFLLLKRIASLILSSFPVAFSYQKIRIILGEQMDRQTDTCRAWYLGIKRRFFANLITASLVLPQYTTNNRNMIRKFGIIDWSVSKDALMLYWNIREIVQINIYPSWRSIISICF